MTLEAVRRGPVGDVHSGVSGNGAVRKPSFIVATSDGLASARHRRRRGRRRPSEPRGRSARWRRRRASRRGRRRTWGSRARRRVARLPRRRRRPGNVRRRCRRTLRRGRPAAPPRPGPAAPMRAGLRMRISFGRSRWPIQAWSGCSQSHAQAPSDPSISYDERVLPARADLRDADGAAGAAVEASRIAAASSVVMARSTRSAERSVEKVSTGPVGSRRVPMNVVRSAMTAATCWPVTKVMRSSQCEPMSPTARRAPPRSGCSRQFQSLSRSSQSWK